MKNKCVLVLLIMAFIACSPAKRITLGSGGIMQRPKNSRKISPEEFNKLNEKFEYPARALDNNYIVDNVSISFLNVQSLPPNVESFEQRIKNMADLNYRNTGHRVSGMQLMHINNNQVLISPLIGNKQFSVYFALRNETNTLTTNGVAQGALTDSAKVDKVVDFIVKHVNFGKE